MIEIIIGECACRATKIATGDVAPGIVTTAVRSGTLVGAGGAQAVETGQLVGMTAVAIEILVLRATATERTLPQLAQVRVDIAAAVTGPIQAIAERAAAACAVARRWLRAAIAGPHQSILFVVTKVFRLTSPGITISRNNGLRR